MHTKRGSKYNRLCARVREISVEEYLRRTEARGKGVWRMYREQEWVLQRFAMTLLVVLHIVRDAAYSTCYTRCME